MASKRRLDEEMLLRGLVESRQGARREVEAGRVLVDGVAADKPARRVESAQHITLVDDGPRYVSRAGQKLHVALDEFEIDPSGWRCLDAGSSTGGFTDCLLARGAASVIAVDVGTGQLHDRLRNDRRVIVREQTDIRTVGVDDIAGPVDAIVADLSFISLRLVLPALASLIVEGGPLLLLVKPQFEAGRVEAARAKGVIRDPTTWRSTLLQVAGSASDLALAVRAATVSPITGTSGNIEFIVWLEAGRGVAPFEPIVDRVVAMAEARNA